MGTKDLEKLPLLLDYLFNLDDAEQRRQTEQLIAEDENIRQLYDFLRRTIEPLEAWRDETPPAGLADRTMQYIKDQEGSGRWVQASAALLARRAEEVYSQAAAANGSRVRWVLHNLRDLAAAAACIIFVFMLLQPSFQGARRRAQQLACANQLGRIGFASSNYALDNNGYLPHLPRSPGATWWSVGQQGEQNVSNTRDAFLLVKLGYLKPKVFLCPGADNRSVQFRLEIDPQRNKAMQDFLGREYINYSFRLLISDQPITRENLDTAVPVTSDINPIFAHFDSGKSVELSLSADDPLLRANSPNHANRGQNLLFPDGSVRFFADRFYQTGPERDDIFTIRATIHYRGTELPKSERDIFIH